MHDMSLRAASVPSHSSGGVRQLSQLPQGLARLAEVVEQPDTAAIHRLAQAQQRVELRAGDALVLLARRRLLDEPALLNDVRQAVDHPGIRGQAVAAGAAGLLVVRLDALRHVEVRDEAHVRLVDAHAEGDGRDHHDCHRRE